MTDFEINKEFVTQALDLSPKQVSVMLRHDILPSRLWSGTKLIPWADFIKYFRENWLGVGI